MAVSATAARPARRWRWPSSAARSRSARDRGDRVRARAGRLRAQVGATGRLNGFVHGDQCAGLGAVDSDASRADRPVARSNGTLSGRLDRRRLNPGHLERWRTAGGRGHTPPTPTRRRLSPRLAVLDRGAAIHDHSKSPVGRDRAAFQFTTPSWSDKQPAPTATASLASGTHSSDRRTRRRYRRGRSPRRPGRLMNAGHRHLALERVDRDDLVALVDQGLEDAERRPVRLRRRAHHGDPASGEEDDSRLLVREDRHRSPALLKVEEGAGALPFLRGQPRASLS